MPREWNTPKREPWNAPIHNILKAIDNHTQEYFKSGEICHLEKADTFGVTDVILDCGIGFGKRLEDNLALIAHQKHFCSLGKPLLVGASRKSMIDTICTSTTQERLGGTLAIHLRAIAEGASMVRVHDVAQHVQAIAVWQALGEL